MGGDSERLAPPGAGVPFWERWTGRFLLLPVYERGLSWEGVPWRLEAQGGQLLALGRDLAVETLERRVLVPRLTGLEDSSRFYSYAMVLEHLTIVGARTGEIVRELTHGRAPRGMVRTADLKPRELPLLEARQRYEAMLRTFRESVLDDTADREASLTFPHPWFGPMDAFRWLCFAPFHQAIHLRQARAIVARGG